MCVGERREPRQDQRQTSRTSGIYHTLQGDSSDRQAADSTATLRISGGDASSLIALLSDNIGRVFLVTGVAVEIATPTGTAVVIDGIFDSYLVSVATTVDI